ISIHGHPRQTYPYFSGFEDEKGDGDGRGFNLNLPLPENIDGERYRRELKRALVRVQKFAPEFLVLALGLDTARGDPTGSFRLMARDFRENGRLIGSLGLPTLVVQEGGYRTQTLGVNARHFFTGLWDRLSGDRPKATSDRQMTRRRSDVTGRAPGGVNDDAFLWAAEMPQQLLAAHISRSTGDGSAGIGAGATQVDVVQAAETIEIRLRTV
ncbi:MAG: hypothetical protein ACREQV_05470, partial [Candidatus Binatia bacterium]